MRSQTSRQHEIILLSPVTGDVDAKASYLSLRSENKEVSVYSLGDTPSCVSSADRLRLGGQSPTEYR